MNSEIYFSVSSMRQDFMTSTQKMHWNQKFIRRFNYLEQETLQKGKNLKDMSLAEMDAIWDEAKQKGL